MDRIAEGQAFKNLKAWLLRLGFLNLAIVAVIGITLRSLPFYNWPLNYGYLLHGHSHFAFGGWLMPMALWAVIEFFPSLVSRVGFRHWKNIAAGVFISAYGMLLSFPFQGYGPFSIVFSTMAVLSGFYLGVVLIRAGLQDRTSVAVHFLIWGVVYMLLSSVGPFATGPLIAMGRQGTPLYYDAIYFYLHFQYNGWFSFLVLALIYKLLENKIPKHGKKVFYLFNAACLPAFFLSTLWNQPDSYFYIIGGAGAFLQLAGLAFLLKDLKLFSEKDRFKRSILLLSLLSLTVKIILQAASAFPMVSSLAFKQRNFIIAYLHLVLLGFISLFFIALFMRSYTRVGQGFRFALTVFVAGFIATETILLAGGFGWLGNSTAFLLFLFSFLLLTGAGGMAWSVSGAFSMPFWSESRLKNFVLGDHLNGYRQGHSNAKHDKSAAQAE